MILGLLLIFAPEAAWLRIERAQRGIAGVLLISTLPLLLFTAAIEGYALMHWGVQRGQFDSVVKWDQESAIRFESIQIGLSLLLILVGAKFIHWISNGFDLETAYRDCFRLVAYSLTPIFLVRLIDGIPALHTWICWTIGALLLFHVLYHGIANVLKPSPTKGFGLYLVSGIALVALSAMAHAVVFSLDRTGLLLPVSG